MRTSYKVGDRCRVGPDLGKIVAILPLEEAYQVRLDNGQTLSIAERLLKLEPQDKEQTDEQTKT